MGAERWHENCKIADGYPTISFIAAGNNIYYDQNSDHVPQQSELLAGNGSLEVKSLDGGATVTLEGISIMLNPSAVSDESPQLLILDIRSAEHAQVRQQGAIVMARDPDSAGTCHLFGELSFSLVPRDFELKLGGETFLKVVLGTIQTNSTTVSGHGGGPSEALICTSAPDDRLVYAFDKSLRPEMEISFSSQSSETEIIVLDGFC